MPKILIDLTPVRPGGENGGAKIMVLELVRQLGLLAPKTVFILLTAHWTHDELSLLDAPNIQRLCVCHPEGMPLSTQVSLLGRCLRYVKRKYFSRIIPPTTLASLKADLLFCPFTAPFFTDLDIPIVSLVYDLQCLEYPYFFSENDRVERHQHFLKACQLASYLVCISAFTRESVLKYSPIDLSPESVVEIPIYVSYESVQHRIQNVPALLKQYDVSDNDFLLYPANFWKHKNHKILLAAFSLYVRKHAQSTLKLVCTGALETERNKLQSVVDVMGLRHCVVFTGYVSTEVLQSLFSTCKALIFPSLYEGFGIPVVEAMLAGKPVLCSKGNSLSEVGGNTAFYFDPRKPNDIVDAIERLYAPETVLNDIILQGYQHALHYLGTDKMAIAYYDVFQKAMKKGRALRYQLRGCFGDGWGSEQIDIEYPASEKERFLEAVLHCPISHPAAPIKIKQADRVYIIPAGETVTIRESVGNDQGKITFSVEEGAFQPSSSNMTADTRWLSCLWQHCEIISDEHTINLLKVNVTC